MVGFVSGGAIREPVAAFDAELYGIYLLDTAQRVGLGTALTCRLAHKLIEIGYRSMIVRVLAANPACSFYERLGGVLVRESAHMVDGQSYPERIYGYADLAELAAHRPV